MKAKLFAVTLLLLLLQKSDLIFSKEKIYEDVRIQNNPDISILNPNYRIYPGSNIQVQTSIAVHPSNPLIMAASAITDVYPGGYTTGAYVTTNGGTNWSGTNSIRDISNNIITTVGDPTIAIDKNGMLVIAYTALPSGGTDYKAGISYSSNNGLHWSPTVYIPGVGRCDKITSIADNSPLSPNFGKIYIVYSDFIKMGLYFSSSSDGGISWDSVKRISLPINDARVGASIALGKYGDIYVSWPFYDTPSQSSYIGFAKSADGGSSWISNDKAILVNITYFSFRIFFNSCRLNGLPYLSVDNSGGERDGMIYITCTEKAASGSPAIDDFDVIIRSSSDQGTSWNSSHRVNQDSTGSPKYQFYPILNTDNHGGVNVIYYDSRNTVTNDSFEVFLARSLNGGIDFEDHLISDHKFKLKPMSPTLFGVQGYIGTYIGVTSADNKIIPVWFDNSSEVYQAWSSKIEFGLDIKIIPQGFYDILTDRLRMTDTIRAYLRKSDSPYNIIDSAAGILDSVTFVSEMYFTNAGSGNYYIEIQHRNALKVWSSSYISYSTAGHSLYDFTLSESMTLGNNAVLINDNWCSYSGDVNSDGGIDMDDVGIIYNAVSQFTNGYSKTDINGDGSVDLKDLNIAFNNSINFVRVITP